MSRTIYIACDPDVFDGATRFPITFLKKKIYIRPAAKPFKVYSLGSDVDEILAEWYSTRGLPIPPEEVGIGAVIDKEEARWMAERERMSTDTLAVKPEFGTPEFWAWARAQRAKKNKERAAAGLPPLPTAKEKAIAKQARAAAKLIQ